MINKVHMQVILNIILVEEVVILLYKLTLAAQYRK